MSGARIHTFRRQVALSVDGYLSPDDALALARELRRFARGCREGIWYGTRVLVDGKFVNECNGKPKPIEI